MMEATQPVLPEDFGNPWMANLQEIELPEPVAFTPETIGWDLLAGLLLLALLWLVRRLWRQWRANGYRRSALAELDDIEKKSPQSLPALLKRVALVSYPRAEVAELAGDAWLAFLDGSLGTTEFTQGVGRSLPEMAYDPGFSAALNAAESERLFALARRWIRRHR